MEIVIGILGIICMLVGAWLFSPYKRDVYPQMIVVGLLLQVTLAVLFLKTAVGVAVFDGATNAANLIIGFSDAGARFLFGDNFKDHFFAFKVLPTIIFVGALSQMLFYWGIMQRIIKVMGVVMQKTMRISGAEAMVAAANVFLGQTEAPLFIKPYLKKMTRSEINVLMVSGMATVAGGVLAAYVGMGISAGHLLAASFMSAPATIVVAKLMLPERQKSETHGETKIAMTTDDINIFEAAVNGASQGLMLALNVAAMLIAFVALMAFMNYCVGAFFSLFGLDLSFEKILGWLFQPVAFIIGVPWADCFTVGQLLGKKIVLNEFIAYQDLSQLVAQNQISAKAATISTYALCGFANFSSIAIQIGGIGNITPERRKDFAVLGLKAMIGGNIASFITACIAGIFV